MNEEELKRKILDEIVEQGYFKIGETTYIIEANEYPHDERCEGSMCWCSARAKKENPDRWNRWLRNRSPVLRPTPVNAKTMEKLTNPNPKQQEEFLDTCIELFNESLEK